MRCVNKCEIHNQLKWNVLTWRLATSQYMEMNQITQKREAKINKLPNRELGGTIHLP